ncbi:hypothetical protein QR46_2139 [Giardia duodenalis assemblage B]|uniref:Uncharacterized protein n=1 Tax=Giardia duodenalis assemblage B TaxID=1394984 RepID=A0A132NUX0_GIAIN|nr:hypothetical protein QR46_2139 [Giardia intestinalis assemblage B]
MQKTNMETRPAGNVQPRVIGLDIIDVFDIPFNSTEGRSYIESLDRGSKGAESWHVLGTTVYHCKPYQCGKSQLSAALRLSLSSKGIRALIYISQGTAGPQKAASIEGAYICNPRPPNAYIKNDAPGYIQHDGAHMNNQQQYPHVTIINDVDTLDVLHQFLTEANSIGRPNITIPQNLAECRVGRSTPWYNVVFYCPGVKFPRPREISMSATRRSQAKSISNPEDCDYIVYPLGAIEYATLYPNDEGVTLTFYHLASMENAHQCIKRLLGPGGLNI